MLRDEQAGAVAEVEWSAPAPPPRPVAAETLSPVDLPEPAAPLRHPLRWTSTTIATASLFLALFNAPAIRFWSYQLPPNAYSAPIVAGAEVWYDSAGRLGLNRPVETVHGWWRSLRERRFERQPSPAASASRSAAQ
jgi:hypothetical protein